MRKSYRSIEPKGIEEKGSLPVDDESIARKLYDFAVKKKLDRVKEFGIDLFPLYNSIKPI